MYPVVIGPVAGKSERRQNLAIKLSRSREIFYAQVNMVKMACFHFRVVDCRFSRRTINFRPDQVSSTAQTYVSTNPSGKATARITSSVISVETLAAFFGQEIHRVPVSATIPRNRFNSRSNCARCVVNKCTNAQSRERQSDSRVFSGSLPSNFR